MKKITLTATDIKLLNKTLRIIGDLYHDEKLPGIFLPKAPLKKNSLSKGELKVLKFICEELTNRQIATKLKLSVRTIEGIRREIARKTKSKNVVGTVKYALKHRIYVLK